MKNLAYSGAAADPLWYKDAVIYETHVKAFSDSNGDGIGDFPGLIEKLDYLQDLGVTCLWLLPFFPSPLRDDGYDIADYENVHPSYGTLDDFKRLLAAAHDRNLQVLIELVINHTSDRHPWFQAARSAPPGSSERDFYVWSDSDKKYSDARIIFTDTEKSNWTWDPVANAFYWHRFFSHQPDLNYDNPAVIERVIEAMRFWMDMGVDGIRLDAIPYLLERDGTNCENLPETHVIIKRLRKALDQYENRLMLAEANQWPIDVRPYFGEGDECHMAFHFPVMPRIFMALRREDSHPITDIMAETPEIPPNCQWGLFLRNHDELTLEMVTADERDYMYLAYSADPKMKINVGIRRRLAPLMENDRRRIELLNSLLFSFPGTPILYYGDEIGMGDNIYLGDRNGVRTPMQWSPDRNAGFSRTDPARLYSPLIMDPVYGYEAVNVESQVSNSSSLLHWMRNMIALRKLFKVFGRGSIEFLQPRNRKVLAYLRRYKDDLILCVANLSRFAQAVELDLSAFAGMTPVEMFGYSGFPVLGMNPYQLSLNSYGFYWFELHFPSSPPEAHSMPAEGVAPLRVNGWSGLFESSAGEVLETQVLPAFLSVQRWFAGKSRQIQAVRIFDWTELPGPDPRSALALVRVRYAAGASEIYSLPLSLAVDARARVVLETTPEKVLCRVEFPEAAGILYDAMVDDDACLALLDTIGSSHEIHLRQGTLRGWQTHAFQQLREAAGPEPKVTRGPANQSNTSAFFSGKLMLKLYRKLEPGLNPDVEVGRYLTEETRFDHVPSLAGAMDYVPSNGEAQTLAMLQRAVENQGDGWDWMLEELARYYEYCATLAEKRRNEVAPLVFDPNGPEALAILEGTMGMSLDSAATIGRRTAELHVALASSFSGNPNDQVVTGNPDFLPEPFTAGDLAKLCESVQENAEAAIGLLEKNPGAFAENARAEAQALIARKDDVMNWLRTLESGEIPVLKIRVHGDYHLGQVLRVKNDYVIVDFEGEPARPLSERRQKHPVLKDMAGMLRSFSYAAHVGLFNYTNRRSEEFSRMWHFARLWESHVSASFLKTYGESLTDARLLPADSDAVRRLLDIFLLDKAFYELRYELDNRPQWAHIPVKGLLQILNERFT